MEERDEKKKPQLYGRNELKHVSASFKAQKVNIKIVKSTLPTHKFTSFPYIPTQLKRKVEVGVIS